MARALRIEYSGAVYHVMARNVKGQLWKQIYPDGVATLYQYNGSGEVEYTAVDLDQNDQIDFSGTDRITRTVRDVVSDHGGYVRRAQVYRWAVDGDAAATLVSTTEKTKGSVRADEENVQNSVRP